MAAAAVLERKDKSISEERLKTMNQI